LRPIVEKFTNAFKDEKDNVFGIDDEVFEAERERLVKLIAEEKIYSEMEKKLERSPSIYFSHYKTFSLIDLIFFEELT
jgi:hypothetical protein